MTSAQLAAAAKCLREEMADNIERLEAMVALVEAGIKADQRINLGNRVDQLVGAMGMFIRQQPPLQ
jgi:hypothetical protein